LREFFGVPEIGKRLAAPRAGRDGGIRIFYMSFVRSVIEAIFAGIGGFAMSAALSGRAGRFFLSARFISIVPIALLLGLAAPASAQVAASRNVSPMSDELMESRGLHDRIVGGVSAEPGKWPSMAVIIMERPGKGLSEFCGGTVIGQQWVLTAAHCVVAMKKMSPPASFFIREGTQDLTSEQRHDIDIVDMISNESYNSDTHLNDVALLKLKSAATSPRQKLVSQSINGSLVVEKRMATVIGYGDTAATKTSSAQLLQVDVPIVGQPTCKRVYGDNAITDANFCAGETGKDSCQGDSGGPLFVTADTGEKLQAGVVSWGSGCAQEGYYGVYASVGNFEQWIKQRVPEAEFAVPGSSESSQAAGGLTDGASTAQKPSEAAQVHIDIVEGNKVRVKSYIRVRVSSSVSGSLVIFNENPDGTAYQLYPSKTFPGPDGRADAAHIQAGAELRIPSELQYAQGYRIAIEPPLGLNLLRAIVVPEGRKIDEIIAQHSDGEAIRDLATVIRLIVDEVQRGAVAVKVTDRGSAEVSYEIVN
jgi:secreted trypsin-like serine protease